MKKRNKFTHKILPFILIGVIASTTVSLNYNKIREVKAVAVVDDVALAGIITLILLSYGYVTMDYYNNTDGTSALVQDWEDAYETARFKVLEGGGGTGDSGDDNNDDDFEDTDGDGKITENDIPTWSKIIGSVGVSGAVSVAIAKNADKLLSPIVSKFIFDKFGNNESSGSSIENLKELNSKVVSYLSDNNLDISSYKYVYRTLDIERYSNSNILYHLKTIYSTDGAVYFYPGKKYCNYLFYNVLTIDTYTGKPYSGSTPDSKSGQGSYVSGGKMSISPYFYWNGPTTTDSNVNLEDLSKEKPNIWVTPDLQNTFDNKSSLNLLPPFDPLASYDIPTQQALQGLLNGLNNTDINPDGQQDLLKDFLNELKNEPTTNPDVKPNPDTGGGGSGDNKPDTGGDSGSDKENSSFTADLKKLFPFCIPFDLVSCFKLFNADPVTPKVEIPVHFGIVNIDYTFVITLEEFNDVAMICRSMFLILYIVGLILVTRSLIRG